LSARTAARTSRRRMPTFATSARNRRQFQSVIYTIRSSISFCCIWQRIATAVE
jgi:hypothetical protein